MFPLLSIRRSAGFQDRQFRNLFTRYYRLRAHFKETVLKYEVEKSQAARKKEKVRERLGELERREAFLEGRKANLLAEKLTREDSSSSSIFFSPPRSSKIRKTEVESIFKDSSGFLDSGNWVFLSLHLDFLNQPNVFVQDDLRVVLLVAFALAFLNCLHFTS